MQAQDKAGFLKDITADVASAESTMSPTAVDAFKVDGKVVGMPFEMGEVAFYYNKKLFEKAGVKAEDIKTWDDFLGAVKKIKAAGITPIVVGAGEKWPMHFYYSYLVMRIGGDNALADAKAGKNGGFKNATFVEAGKRLRELGGAGAVPARLPLDHPRPIGGHVRRRQGGDGPDGPMVARHAGAELGRAARACRRTTSASCPSPSSPAARARRPIRSAASTAGWSPRPRRPQAVDFLKFFSQEKYAKEAAATGAYIPVVKGAEASIVDPLFKRLADDLAASTYHQNYFDQDLGPSVGRVINDVSVAVAAGEMTPEAAAAAIQEAAEQQ